YLRHLPPYLMHRAQLSLLSLFFSLLIPRPPISTLFPYTTLFRSCPLCTTIHPRSCGRPSRSRQTRRGKGYPERTPVPQSSCRTRSEEHTSELQSRFDLVCRLLLEKKKVKIQICRL